MPIKNITSFDFEPGRILVKKYRVISRLGMGWEGEVYKLTELETGIERAGKFFFPHRNTGNRALRFYAKILHRLRHCSILIQYNTQEMMIFRGRRIAFLVSEYVEGILLSDFLKRQPGKKLNRFEALHLLHALAKGLDCVHSRKEYHGDLHPYNIIITGYGLEFTLKLIDMFHWQAATAENIRDDIYDLIRIFYDSLGGAKTYAKQPQEIKQIICGLKKTLIRKKYRTARQLRAYLENMWLDSLL